MNTYQKISKLSDELFRRKTGIKRKTFKRMVEILTEAELDKKKLGGKPNKLSIEERLLMWLEYVREYRTYFHTAASYGISESACFRNCVWIENTLIKAKESKILVQASTKIQGDTGYQGIQKIRMNSDIPYRRKRNAELSKDNKKYNHLLSSKRIFVEHVIGRLKRFKVISERYRNRRHRFGLRFNLIAGVYNFEL